MSRDDAGFTLIELLVVVLILAVMAAIAIPAIINQRKKGAAAQVNVALKDMSVMQQSYLGTAGTYATTVPLLVTEGFRYSDNIVPSILWADLTTYCLRVESALYPQVRGEFSSEEAFPVTVTNGTDPPALPPC